MSKQFWANLALSVVLGGLVIFAVANFSTAITARGLLVTEPEPSAAAAPLLPQVVLTRFEVGESLNRVVEANFYVQNKSDRDVKNIEVLCEILDARKNPVDREQWTLFETVPAGQSVRLSQVARRFVSTRARGLKCGIVDLQPAEKPFFSLARVAAAGHGTGQQATGHDGAAADQHGQAMPAGH